MTTKSKPILFSAPMVQALLREIENPGTGKTQTRRIIKPQPTPEYLSSENLEDLELQGIDVGKVDDKYIVLPKCPYGKTGDLLYVRETWNNTIGGPRDVSYKATVAEDVQGAWTFAEISEMKWTPSIHMPRWASRITLEVTDVRVERLQDISEEDAKAEGVERLHDGWFPYGIQTFMTTIVDGREVPAQYCREAKGSFRMLWESINGPESWKSNDWVWAVSFKPHLINVDQMIKERAAA